MPRKKDKVPATLRAVSVLEALVAAERPTSLAELTGTLRLPKPTLYRMLAMLEAANLVAREPGARGYASDRDSRYLGALLVPGHQWKPLDPC